MVRTNRRRRAFRADVLFRLRRVGKKGNGFNREGGRVRQIIKAWLMVLAICLGGAQPSCSNKSEQSQSAQKTGSFDDSRVNIRPLFRIRDIVELESGRGRLISFPFDMCINDGKLFIASRASTIKVFTLKGEFVRTIGGLGDGPGEYRWIVALFNVGSDRIGIYDFKNLRLSVYTTDGDYVWSKRFALPDVVSIRSIEYYDGRFYFHVPPSEKHPFYLIVTNEDLHILHQCVAASADYKGYFHFGYITGSVVVDSNRGKLYDINGFSYRPAMIDLTTWETTYLEYHQPSFFRTIAPIRNVPDNIDQVSESFRQGTDVFRAFLLNGRYLLIEFDDQHGPGALVQTYYVVLDLNTEKSYTGSDRESHPYYSDGKYLYDLFYSGRSPTSEEDDYVRNPRLIVYELIEPPQK